MSKGSDEENWIVMTSPALAKFECRFDEVVVTDPATTDAGIVSKFNNKTNKIYNKINYKN